MSKTGMAIGPSGLENTGGILSLIGSGAASSRAALLEASGMSRGTVTQRLNALLECGLVQETAQTLPSGGRPTRVLAIQDDSGYMLVGNIGESRIRLAIMSLEPAIIAQTTIPFDVHDEPEPTLARIAETFDELVRQARPIPSFLAGLSFSLPTPVNFKLGCVVGPSVLYNWNSFDIKGWFGRRYEAPVLVENDVNLMTLFEHRSNFPDAPNMLFIKVGTGIGSGMIVDDKIFRGAQGVAGDIGHIQFESEKAPLCRCGKLGCVEARSAGWAIARDLRELGYPAENARDVVDLVEHQTPEAIMLLREAGRTIGEVTSDVVSIINPSLIVIGGTLARTGELLLAGIRELIYQRCLPLATQELHLALSLTEKDSEILGAAMLLKEEIFSQIQIDDTLRRFAASYSTKR